MSYSKDKLASDLADLRDVSKASAAETIDALFNLIRGATEAGEKVTLRGFGTFALKTRAARTGRNPQTGLPVEIPASTTLTFKAAKPKA
jgi:nucleoid DNA-binding protein